MTNSFCIVFTCCRVIQIGMSSKYSQPFFYLLCKFKCDSFFADWEFYDNRGLTLKSGTNLLVYFTNLGFILGNESFSHNTAGRCHVCDTVDQNQLSKCSVLVKFVYHDLL